MPYKKSKPRDTEDHRPENLKGENFNMIMGTNLRRLQDEVGWTNRQMCDLLGISTSTYDRLLSGENAISIDKLSIMYFNLKANLHRLVGNDTNCPILCDSNDEGYDFYKGVSDLIMDIENTDAYDERAEKIMYLYSECGKMITYLMRPERRNR